MQSITYLVIQFFDWLKKRKVDKELRRFRDNMKDVPEDFAKILMN
jgi:hypothetical protein